ncbi:hypothetical protein AS1_51 [Marinobacter phage AS1]|nr:hypothetical protein AS1_51 [Marinobacter phage AS1]
MISYCPSYVEVLKETIEACNDDKADVRSWDQSQAQKLQELNE